MLMLNTISSKNMAAKKENQYEAAASVIELATKKKGNLKSLCFQSGYSNKKKLYALVCQTVKYKKILNKVLSRLDINGGESEIGEYLRLVVAYEIVLGKGIKCHGAIGNFAEKYADLITEAWLKLQEDGEIPSSASTEQVALPRYVRVNTLKTGVDDVIEAFKKEGFQFDPDLSGECNEETFTRDSDIPEVLVFSPGTDFHRHPLYQKGHILLQDKASCLPAFLLKPKPSSTVIDACAAPGNKTTHLASIMNNQGKILAFDMDEKRLKLLKNQLKIAGTENVYAQHQDFLKTNPKDERLHKVKYILLDPTCSGSGMTSRMDNLLDDGKEDKEKLNRRLDALSRFQYAMLSHALSFPKVKKVSYSTCSVHQKENEDVVERCLQRFKKNFELVDLLPSWKHRGLASFEEGPKCLRASSEEDKTNGFFVAIFKRFENKVEENEVQNGDGVKEETVPEAKKASKRKRKQEGQIDKQNKNASASNGETPAKANKKRNYSLEAKRRRRMARKPVTAV